MKGLCKENRNKGEERGGKEKKKGMKCIMSGKGGGKDRWECREGEVNKERKERMDIGEDELIEIGGELIIMKIIRCKSVLKRLRIGLVMFLMMGKVKKKFESVWIDEEIGRIEIEKIRMLINIGGGIKKIVDEERKKKKVRIEIIIENEMIEEDKRNKVEKEGIMKINKWWEVVVLIWGNMIENIRRLRKIVEKEIGIRKIDEGIIIIGGYGKRKNLMLRKRIERE